MHADLSRHGARRFALARYGTLSVRYDYSTASSGRLNDVSYVAYAFGLVLHE